VRRFGAVWSVENVLAVVVVVDGGLVAGLVLEWSSSMFELVSGDNLVAVG